MNRLVFGAGFDPVQNLAAEEWLFDTQGPGATLYLWQNRNTVVVGKNQNAWSECRTGLLEAEGGTLVRRSSGGGAVYHDLGNLNFTFLVRRADYDPARQFAVVSDALAAFGIEAVCSGRNDLVTADGAKFSGSAFRHADGVSLHHGTLLVSADMEKLTRYLAPSPEKLAAKGVQSVRARVTNLCEHSERIDVPALQTALAGSFEHAYGPAERCTVPTDGAMRRLTEKYGDWAWRYGGTPAFDLRVQGRFPWGGAELLLCLTNGRIAEATLFTDAMDETLADRVISALTGARLDGAEIAGRLRPLGAEGADLARLLKEKTA